MHAGCTSPEGPCYAFEMHGASSPTTGNSLLRRLLRAVPSRGEVCVHHDRSGRAFRFAPLQGETFQRRVPAGPAGLPDSIVVLTRRGSLLVRSTRSFIFFGGLAEAGEFLRPIAVIPRPLRDAVYDFVARIRYLVFGRREDVCPVPPPELRARFDR